ncbi:ECF transporter S component [Arthrobacter castelli]|uniref:ECF transporter S component n=1 Tax=Arthrobacter castelli TaxID=271431 RepID=UPI0004278746|nr:ECF transporter S component [Arthrobacter castelli]
MTTDPKKQREHDRRKGFFSRIAADFTTRAWVLIPIGIAINFVGATLAEALSLPLFLDSLGTMLIAILAGPWVAGLTGLLGNIIFGITVDPTALAFIPSAVALGLVAGFLARHGWLKSYLGIVGGGILLALTSTIVSAPIVVMVFGGAGGSGVTAVRAVFMASGAGIWQSVASSQILVDLADKLIQLFIAVTVARAVPSRYRPKAAQRSIADRITVLPTKK